MARFKVGQHCSESLKLKTTREKMPRLTGDGYAVLTGDDTNDTSGAPRESLIHVIKLFCIGVIMWRTLMSSEPDLIHSPHLRADYAGGG